MATLTQTATPLSLDAFPDGLKTTGQHPPLYDALRPFDKFPKSISGPTLWKPEDYKDAPEKWTHRFSAEEIAELSATADAFLAATTPLTGISKVVFIPLSTPTSKANNNRATSLFPSSPPSLQTSARTSSMAKASSSSRASPWRNGATTSLPSPTWVSAHT